MNGCHASRRCFYAPDARLPTGIGNGKVVNHRPVVHKGCGGIVGGLGAICTHGMNCIVYKSIISPHYLISLMGRPFCLSSLLLAFHTEASWTLVAKPYFFLSITSGATRPSARLSIAIFRHSWLTLSCSGI